MPAARVVAITGVSRGLGRALARRFAEAGHRVAGCARSHAALRELREELGAHHHFAAVDVRQDQEVQGWAEQVLTLLGPPDLLVNNAALIHRTAPLWKLFPDEFDDVIDVNVKGTANVVRHFVPAMAERGSGVIVNLSSYWGRSGAAGEAGYCASKWAVEGLTRALARELPPGLAAVALNPGVVDTAMLRVAFGDDAGDYLDPETWSHDAAPFLLSLGPGNNGAALTVPGQ